MARARVLCYMLLVFIASFVATLASITAGTTSECPSWYVPVHSDNSSEPTDRETCRCGSELKGVIHCGLNSSVSLSIMHCMTHDHIMGTVEGYCPYSNGKTSSINTVFKKLPSNASKLTEFTCGWLNRRGILCSRCKDNLGVAVLSYHYECVSCLGKLKGWTLYLTLALVPLTLFFFAVIIFDIDATATHMNSLLCIMQILTFSFNTNPQTFIETGNHASNGVAIAAWTIVGFWNLDIFRYVFPSFCISQEMSILQVIAMEYIIAFYPFLLVLLCYVLIELHDHDFRAIKVVWGVWKKWLHWLKGKWYINIQAKSSIIRYFSTFLLLSYMKVLFVSYNLLALTSLNRRDGSVVNGSSFVYYNASVKYLSSQHLPYFVLASVTLFIFNFLPLLLLLLYPTKLFQKFMSKCKFVRWHPLHTFADKFQGCYKNRTNGSCDYRYFAGIYLLIRILYHLRMVWNSIYSMFITQIIPLFAAALFGVLRPYRNDFYNRLDCIFFTLLTFGQICLATNKYMADIPITFLYLLASIPLGYLIILILYKCIVVCAPSTARKLERRVRAFLLNHNLFFSPESDTINSYGSHSDSFLDGGQDEHAERGLDRPLLSPASTVSSSSCELKNSGKTTYSACAIYP